MGLFSKFRRRLDGPHASPSAPASNAPRPEAQRQCRFETMEPRQLMAADLHFGGVYYEPDEGQDIQPDVIEVTFEGGAAGTQLNRVIINGDKRGDGMTDADVFFDLTKGGLGADQAIPLKIISQDGFQVTGVTVVDGGMQIIFDLKGFDAGEKLVFSLDVDEANYVNDDGSIDVSPIVEGKEFQRSQLSGFFSAKHFEDKRVDAIFWDEYDDEFAAARTKAGSTLNLPNDARFPTNNVSNRTAGAVAVAAQTPLPISISGVVYVDQNLNNKQEAGDTGIANVKLSLWKYDDATGKFVDTGKTATTDAQGAYKFDSTGGKILPGRYEVREAQPSGYFSVGSTPGKIDGAIVGQALTADVISKIDILGGQDSVRNDFAEALPAEISGYVYHDRNNNGVKETGEEGIANTTVQVVAVDTITGFKGTITVTTDANGFYKAVNLIPGKYRVVESQPAGYLDGIDAVGTVDGQKNGQVTNPGDELREVSLLSGKKGVNYNFGELKPNSISGRVHADPEGDCTFGPNDIPLQGVQVDLFNAQGQKIATTYTNAQGIYKFDGLSVGSYTVFEHTPQGYFDGGEKVGSAGGAVVGNDRVGGIVLVSDTHGVNYNFCENIPNSISGRVHADPEGDCTFGPNDIPLEGVQVDLFNEQGQKIATAYTDKQGRYKFDNLARGSYTIFEHTPQGYIDGGQKPGSAGGTVVGNDRIGGIVLVSGDDGVDYNFCENIPLKLSGYVYHDRDNDGVKDPGEEGISGVKLELRDENCQPTGIFVTTNAQGFYEFTGLAAGKYGVSEVQPAGWLDGLDTPGNQGGSAQNPGDKICGAELAWGEVAVNYNFGELKPSSIGGRVHADFEGDCTVGEKDILLQGVQIDLFNEQGQKIATTYTDAQGRYLFNNLGPGKYSVFEHQPQGYFDSGDHVGSAGGYKNGNDRISGITLVSGTQGVNYNFCENIPVTLSGFVYHDRNNNGVKEAGEEGIAGVKLELRDENCDPTGVFVTTNAQGYYEFTGLAAGKYGVSEVQPVGWLDGLDTPGNRGGGAQNPGDKICGAELDWGKSGANYNFGELLPGTIRGRVIADQNGNCTLDPGESPLAGVVIQLRNKQGEVLATTKTDKNGNYEFTGLRPGEYAVFEQQPTGYFHQAQHIGSGGGVVLGQDYVGGIQVGSGQVLINYNFCEKPPAVLAGYVFQDGDVIRTEDGRLPANLAQIRDGLRTSDDKPLAGVVLELRHGVTGELVDPSVALPGTYSGSAIRVLTDANGYYEFVGLPPGIYAVFQVQPDTYLDGIDTPGSTGGLAANPHLPLDGLILSQLSVDPGQDAILRIRVTAGQRSIENNFSEVVVQKKPDEILFPQVPMPYRPAPVLGLADVPDEYYSPLLNPPTYETPNLYGGAGKMLGYTWHLSVVDAGQPRALNRADVLVQLTGTQFDAHAWRGYTLKDSQWLWESGEGDGMAENHLIFGHPHAIPVTGDFNGDGVADVGVFIKGEWFIDINGNGVWDDSDLWAKLGHDQDQPVTGDWDGDGKTDIGIFGPAWAGDPKAVSREPGLPDQANNKQEVDAKNLPPQPKDAALGARTMKLTSKGRMRADLIDHVFHYGAPGDKAVTGDWNGDGIETIAVFRNGSWHLDVDGDGLFTDKDQSFQFGEKGDLPVVGDWTGEGIDKVGVFRGGRWILDTNGNRQIDAADRVFELGQEGDLPIAADFNGDGVDQPGIYRPQAAKTASR